MPFTSRAGLMQLSPCGSAWIREKSQTLTVVIRSLQSVYAHQQKSCSCTSRVLRMEYGPFTKPHGDECRLVLPLLEPIQLRTRMACEIRITDKLESRVEYAVHHAIAALRLWAVVPSLQTDGGTPPANSSKAEPARQCRRPRYRVGRRGEEEGAAGSTRGRGVRLN